MEEIIRNLKKHESTTPSQWREKADELGMTQKALAEQMNVSQQYVDRILKGRENLSLETLSKIRKSKIVNKNDFISHIYSLQVVFDNQSFGACIKPDMRGHYRALCLQRTDC
jgi:transcriptional regulator with XRE-family HTH domain